MLLTNMVYLVKLVLQIQEIKRTLMDTDTPASKPTNDGDQWKPLSAIKFKIRYKFAIAIYCCTDKVALLYNICNCII